MQTETLFCNLPLIETARIKLRKINLFDTQDIYDYACDPQVSKYLLWDTHKSTITTRKFISNIMQNYMDGKPSPWGLELKNPVKLIGTIGFNYFKPEEKVAEVGYVLSRKFWNLGIMTEVLHRIVDFGFEEIGLVKIEAKCNPLNVPSQKVLEKTGFVYQGITRQFSRLKGEYYDVMLFARSR